MHYKTPIHLPYEGRWADETEREADDHLDSVCGKEGDPLIC